MVPVTVLILVFLVVFSCSFIIYFAFVAESVIVLAFVFVLSTVCILSVQLFRFVQSRAE